MNIHLSRIFIALWIVLTGILLFSPHPASANETTSSISDVAKRSDNSCEWVADSKISCEGYDFFFVVTYSVQADQAIFRNMKDDGSAGNVYIAVSRSGTAKTGMLTTNSSGTEVPESESVELTANGKMYERRLYAPSDDLKDIDWSDSWSGSNYDKATGKYTEDGLDAYFLCGLLSREGQTCIRQTTGDTMVLDGGQGDKIYDIYKSIKDGIDSSANCSSNSLSFILCPLLDGMKDAINYLTGSGNAGDKGFLGDLLNVNPLTNGATTLDRNNDPIPNYTYLVWANIRDISLGLLIIIFVVIIFGNGLGIDAYTVKRSLPRLALGALFTFASFFILQTLIDLSNVLGNAVPDLLLRVASNDPNIRYAFDFNLGAAGGIAAIILILILYFLALIAVLIGIAGLIARQLIIYVLVLTAPVAFVMWVLPNTEKLFKKWWSNLIKVLMMYPIVTGMLAVSLLFQRIVGADDGAPFAVRLVGMTAPLLALMAIPKTFKMGGELFAGAAGFAAGYATKATDWGKGKAGGYAKNKARFGATLAADKMANLGTRKDEDGNVISSRAAQIAGKVAQRVPGIGSPFSKRKRAIRMGERQAAIGKHYGEGLDNISDGDMLSIFNSMSERQKQGVYGQQVLRKLNKRRTEMIGDYATAVRGGQDTSGFEATDSLLRKIDKAVALAPPARGKVPAAPPVELDLEFDNIHARANNIPLTPGTAVPTRIKPPKLTATGAEHRIDRADVK